MKKLMLLLAAATLFAGNTIAQYKPTAGSVSTEVQFNPFDQDGQTFKLDGLKLRFFITDNDALRLKLGFSSGHTKYDYQNEGPEYQVSKEWFTKSSYRSKSGDISLNLGYERHFNVSKRISIYAGAAMGFKRHFVSSKSEGYTETYYTEDKWRKETTTYKTECKNGEFTTNGSGNTIYDIEDRAYWAINADLFTGIDFYVYKGLYVGAELGLNVSSLKYSDLKFNSETTVDNITTKKEINSKDDSRITTVRIDVQPTLRLGWTF